MKKKKVLRQLFVMSVIFLTFMFLATSNLDYADGGNTTGTTGGGPLGADISIGDIPLEPGGVVIDTAKIGNNFHGHDFAAFAHKSSPDKKNGYALMQHISGRYTFVNKLAGGGYIGFRVNNKDKMVISNNGNVGIGETKPTTKLDVNGTTKTNVIEITGGSDLAEPFDIIGMESIKPGMVGSD